MMWIFPTRLFSSDLFEEIFIMTHQFESQTQSYFFKYYDIPYDIFFLYKESENYFITDDRNQYKEDEWKQKVAKNLKILVHEKLNEVGFIRKTKRGRPEQPLTFTWYGNKKNKEYVENLNDGLENYFQNITEAHAHERLWTCYKSHRDQLVSHNVTVNHWLAYNARATNEYGERKYLAYMINRYPNPSLNYFFAQKNMEINKDEFALSDCIQWIWRSRIRNFHDVLLYVPSARMRNLLINYFDLVIDEQIPSKRLKID